jgi:hypothetical protein
MQTFRKTLMGILAATLFADVGANVNHGARVYVTKEELHRAEFISNYGEWVALVCGIALVILSVYAELQGSQPRSGLRM